MSSASQMGGATSFTYAYDDLYRLTSALGTFDHEPTKRHSYSLAMAYDTIHNITAKTQNHFIRQSSGALIAQKKTTYDWNDYLYQGAQPHAPTHIGQRTFAYDTNGNQTGWTHDVNGTRRTITWDEENRIQAVADNGHTMTYKYNDVGDRVIKQGPQGETVYVNQFFTIRNREAGTKHVFAGPTRAVSKLMKQPQPDGTPPGGAKNANNPHSPVEKDLYFYHPDHLGSSSYITDAKGDLYQHLEYFPFGETWVEESSNTQRTPYLFTGKELDEETGLYYFGARYYDPRTSVWQSADPILVEYLPQLDKKNAGLPGAGGVFTPFNLNLYGYSHQRPVIVVDPDGREPVTATAAAVTVTLLVLGTLMVEYGTDLADDGQINGTGPIAGATRSLIDSVAALMPEPGDPSMTDLALEYPFRNPTNIQAMAQGHVTQGMQVSANRATAILAASGQPSQVRIQLQTGVGANRATISSVSLASPSGTVTRLQGQGGLALLYIQSLGVEPDLATSPGFYAALADASRKIQAGAAAGGIDTGPQRTTLQSRFIYRGQPYEIDIEIYGSTPQFTNE